MFRVETITIQLMKIGLLDFFHLLLEFLKLPDLFLEIVVVSWKIVMIHFGNYLILHINSLTSYAVGIKMETFALTYSAYSP